MNHFWKPLLNLSWYSLCFMFCFMFCPWGMWDLSSLIRDQTHTPCIGRWSLNHCTPRESHWWVLISVHSKCVSLIIVHLLRKDCSNMRKDIQPCLVCRSLLLCWFNHLKTHFTFWSMSDRNRPIPWCSIRKEKCIKSFCSLSLFTSSSLEIEIDMRLSCARSHPRGHEIQMAGCPKRPGAKVAESPEKYGSVPLGKGCMCVGSHRTTQHHSTSKQELLLIKHSQENLLCFERSIFKWETAWAVGWFNTC